MFIFMYLHVRIHMYIRTNTHTQEYCNIVYLDNNTAVRVLNDISVHVCARVCRLYVCDERDAVVDV